MFSKFSKTNWQIFAIICLCSLFIIPTIDSYSDITSILSPTSTTLTPSFETVTPTEVSPGIPAFSSSTLFPTSTTKATSSQTVTPTEKTPGVQTFSSSTLSLTSRTKATSNSNIFIPTGSIVSPSTFQISQPATLSFTGSELIFPGQKSTSSISAPASITLTGTTLSNPDLTDLITSSPMSAPTSSTFTGVTRDALQLNSVPTANSDSLSVTEDSTNNSLDVLANDSTLPDEGEILTISSVGTPNNGGTATTDGSTITYSPVTDFTGTETFTYTINDGTLGAFSSTLVSVTVNDINDPPTANDDPFTVNEDSTDNNFDVRANDSTFPDNTGEVLTITAVGTPDNGGTANIVGGVIVYAPATDFFGTETFTYTINDGTLGSDDTATVTVTVDGVNDPPTANDDSLSVDEDSANNSLDVLANDSISPDTGEILTITTVGTPDNGGTATTDGFTITYSPSADFFGIEEFTYTITDGIFDDTATVTVTVDNVNDPPTANDDPFTVSEDSPNNSLDVLANDSISPDTGETLTITTVGTPNNGGTATTDGSTITYTPFSMFFGTETFTYTINDGTPGSDDTATVTVTVDGVNDPPTANDDSLSVDEDSANNSLDVLANDSISPDTGETLTITTVGTPNNGGTATTDGLTITYNPAPDFFGTEIFTYTINDGTPGSDDTATVTVTVDNVNDPPTASNDTTFSADEDSANNSLDVLANDSISPDIGETLTITAVGTPDNGGTATTDGLTITYSPGADFFGIEEFTYTINDGILGSDDTATVRVTVNGINDLPTANNDPFTVNEDSTDNNFGVLANDSISPDTVETLTITAVGATNNGGTATTDDLTITYNPATNFFGTETFTYTINDGTLGSDDTATVIVTIDSVNDPPTANDDSLSVDEDTFDNILDVLAGDSFLPDIGETLTITVVDTSATIGAAVIDGNTIKFTPSAEFNGVTSFVYTISDGNGGIDTATTTVTVTPINDNPQAADDSAATPQDTSIEIDVLSNDTDLDVGDILTIVSATQGDNGIVFFTPTSITYEPNPSFTGIDSFSYIIQDSGGFQDSATVTVTVSVLTVDFDDTSYIITHAGILTIADSGANSDPGSKQTIIANVKSDTDTTGININLEETKNDSGTFVSDNFILFTTDQSDPSISNLKSAIGDTVTATYNTKSDTATIIDDNTGLPTEGTPIDTNLQGNCSGQDGDGDGICDFWEDNSVITGLRIQLSPTPYQLECGSGKPDPVCPSVAIKDIYLEIDWMTGHEPDDKAINDVVAAFAAQGINLHVQKDEDVGLHESVIILSNDGSGISSFDDIKSAFFGTLQDRTGTVQEVSDRLTAKRQVFHYALFAHDNISGSSALAEAPGNDILITLGSFTGSVGSRDQQAGTLMHEMGHNLNLIHGGPAPTIAEVGTPEELHKRDNCKPNYLSVMSYSRQFEEFVLGRTLGFSEQALATLNENAGLNENNGIQLYAPNTFEETAYGPTPIQTTLTGIAVDWNRDTDTTDTGVTANINNFGISGCNDDDYTGVVALKELKGYEDWSALQYTFRGEGTFSDGVHTASGVVLEIGPESLQQFRSLQIETISDAITTLPGSEPIQEDLIAIDELIAQGNLDQAILELQEVRTELEGLGADSEILVLVDEFIESLQIAALPPNLPPIANDDDISTAQVTPVIISVLENDGDPEGDSIFILDVTNPSDGTIKDNEDGTITYTPNAGFTGIDSIGYTISDNTISEIAGTDTATVTVTVEDGIAPEITAPEDLIVQAAGEQTAVDIGVATATDNSGIEPIITNDAPASFPLGDTIVTWTATDSLGNFAIDTQTITVEDTTPPSFIPLADITVLSSTAISINFDVIAVDDVDAEPEISCLPQSGSEFSLGETTVTCTTTDFSGNSVQTSFTVTLDDSIISIPTFEELIAIIASLELDEGITNSLSSKIDSAAASIEDGNTEPAINKLEAFINQVNAQDGKKLSAEQAESLRELANLLIEKISS